MDDWWFRSLYSSRSSRTNLKHGDEVNVVLVQHLIHEPDKLLDESLVLLEPGGVEVESKRGSVRGIVSVEVVS